VESILSCEGCKGLYSQVLYADGARQYAGVTVFVLRVGLLAEEEVQRCSQRCVFLQCSSTHMESATWDFQSIVCYVGVVLRLVCVPLITHSRQWRVGINVYMSV
jgi:hypothetical protein